MKKIMLIGKSGCGKTSLCQRIFYNELSYKKTQSVEVIGGSAIDTPGEYLEHRQFYKALVVTAVEADAVLLLHSAEDTQFIFSPRMSHMFNRPLIGVITKTDLCSDAERLKQVEYALMYAGATKVFGVSNTTGEGIAKLVEHIEDL
ncbi:MAG: EutP/PduV family microcompartment system protein [Clostridia bacterium]|nr:EutP/PduV family microcompartment system protein [Clostridia bacterium]